MRTVEALSQREFARREGCSPTLVRQKIKSGHLKALPDGKIDPALVGTAWRKKGAAAKKPGAVTAKINGKSETKAQAEVRKEHFNAKLRELEYDRESGAVVLIEDVATEVSAQFAKVRTRLLGIASKVAPRAAVLRSVTEVKSLIDDEVALALKELSLDGHGRVSINDLKGELRERFAASS